MENRVWDTGLLQHANLLFRRSYVIMTRPLERDRFPTQEHFVEHGVGNLHVYVHKDQHFVQVSMGDVTAFLIGHAYDPFEDIREEKTILAKVAAQCAKSGIVDSLPVLKTTTGVYLVGVVTAAGACFVQDCCGLMPAYYAETPSGTIITSHAQLAADLCDLAVDESIREYLNAPFYSLGIRILPGLKSRFRDLRLLTPNTCLVLPSLEVVRFYPIADLAPVANGNLAEICDALCTSMRICAKRWKAAISLSGGIDSRMTLAAANGMYDRFKYFSFVSSDAEARDAGAAKQICRELRLPHRIFRIPEAPELVVDYHAMSSIIEHNTAYFRTKGMDSEIRKIAYLASKVDFEMEIKSHVSEVARAFYHKKIGMRHFRMPLRPRDMSNLTKRNLVQRRILGYMDRAFSEFVTTTRFGDFPQGYDEADMFYWEHRMSAWGGLVRQGFELSHETTVIYNNRSLLELFLQHSLADRIHDIPQMAVIRRLNPALGDISAVPNRMKRFDRIALENVFYRLNSWLP